MVYTATARFLSTLFVPFHSKLLLILKQEIHNNEKAMVIWLSIGIMSIRPTDEKFYGNKI